MVGVITKTGLGVVALLAILFQVYLKDAVWLGLGIGKEIEPISNFPYTCRRIEDPRMQSCEDMWLSESTRQLFLACSDPVSRPLWMPNVAHLNLSARSTKDAVVALDIDKPNGNSFDLRVLRTPGFSGTAGDGLLDLVGFTGVDHPETGRVELLIINNGPSVDPVTGKYAEQYVTGANATVELFETGSDAKELKHVHTYAHEYITSPNRVAALSSSAFYITNDHGQHKIGLQHHLSPFLATGDVTFCDRETGCKIVSNGHKFPNGLTLSKDGLLYVPNSLTGIIKIFKILPNKDLEQVDELFAGYSIDNISADRDGDLYVAAFPRGIDIFKAYDDPHNARPAAAALRLRRSEGKYVLEKAIEDAGGEALPAATTVVHDAKTGRLFFSSVISPFISVCDPKKA